MSLGMPHPVLFKDFKGMNYASYRSAMLEAWRLFRSRRIWFGEQFCSPIYRMLQEEAYLRGDLKINNFYSKIWAITAVDWIGPPKGQIEPVKENQADKLANEMLIKSKRMIALERSLDIDQVFDEIEDEEREAENRDIKSVENDPQKQIIENNSDDGDENGVDDES